MLNLKKQGIILGFLLPILLTVSCKYQPASFEEVKVWELDDPAGLNPYTEASSANGSYIRTNIFQKLLNVDPGSAELVPVLAIERPEITIIGDSSMHITFEIRPEAKWDNGDLITAKDVEFSFKVIMCPKVDASDLRPYVSFVESFKFYDNPRKFTFVCDEVHMRAEYSVGFDVEIIPAYVYDPDGLLNDFSYQEIRNNPELENNETLTAFADIFNSPEFKREKGHITGSGPYSFESWVTGQRITLTRKENWWGNDIGSVNAFFEAYPSTITYEFINDFAAAVTALKGEKVDVMRSIRASDYIELVDNKNFNEKFNLHLLPAYVYTYLGINTRNPKLDDKLTRQALAQLVDYDRLIRDLQYGFAQRVVGPVNPSNTRFYNSDITPYAYNVNNASALLASAGWDDSNGNGILDKEINGELVDLEIEFTYNTGNTTREQLGLILQQACESVGIKLTLQSYDATFYRDKIRNHDFEMYYSGWGADASPEDYNQIFSTAATVGGSNHTFFGNEETDALINQINKTLDEAERAVLVRRFQEILHEEVSYIFLWSPNERIAINKRFTNTYPSVIRPGYWVAGFKLDEMQEDE